jgi:ubiquitin carboxyl-terminal hydrolase L3
MTDKKQRWFPLESNPSVMNYYIQKLGFGTAAYEMVDVYATEDWALEMIPQPVAAVVMLYPLTEKQTSFVDKTPGKDAPNVWFIKQRIGNACGTIGLLHALLNLPEPLRDMNVSLGSWLHQFRLETINKNPLERAIVLESDNVISTLHSQATLNEENQTARGELDDNIITHFISLVCVDNKLYELDGRKEGPVLHGDTIPDRLLNDACKVVKEFMERDPDEMRFTILALAPKQDDTP